MQLEDQIAPAGAGGEVIDAVAESVTITPPAPAEELSLRETLKAAQKEVTDRVADDAGQPRGPDGKFAPKAGEAPSGTTPPPAAADPNAVLGTAPTVPRIPDAWGSPERRAAFEKLPPELQGLVTSREAEVAKEFTRNGDERRFAREMKDVITPYMPMITAEGGNPATAVQSLLNTAYVLRAGTPEQKAQALRTVAQQFNVDLASVTAPAAFVDPAFENMTQRLDRLERERQAEVQGRQASADAVIQTEIASFASDPEHKHYEQVKPRMAALLQSGAASDLKDAYEQACWADPSIRSSLQADAARRAEEQRVADAKARADAAKRASGSVFGGPGATTPAAIDPNRSLRDEIKVNLAASQGRL